MIPNEIREQHDAVCKRCKIRKQIAKIVDAHFDWIDCPYDCPNDYEHWEKNDIDECITNTDEISEMLKW